MLRYLVLEVINSHGLGKEKLNPVLFIGLIFIKKWGFGLLSALLLRVRLTFSRVNPLWI